MLLLHRRGSSCSRYEMSHAQHLKWFNFLEFQSFSVCGGIFRLTFWGLCTWMGRGFLVWRGSDGMTSETRPILCKCQFNKSTL
jgi:hypothetical protein